MKFVQATSRRPIGLDIGSRRIKAVQLAGQSSRWRISASASLNRQISRQVPELSEVKWLRGLLSEHGFRGDQVALAVPENSLRMNVLELPPRKSGAPVESLARSEMSRMHKMAPECFEMACWDLPSPARASNSSFVLAAACAHCDADDIMDVMEQAGFDVVGLDINFLATARACRPLLKDIHGSAAILDIGWSSARLILLHDGVVVYVNNLSQSGLGGLVQSLSQTANVDQERAERVVNGREGLGQTSHSILQQDEGAAAAEDGTSEMNEAYHRVLEAYAQGLSREMNTPISYMISQYPQARLERLLLIGGGGGIPGMADLLASILGVKIHSVSVEDIVDTDGDAYNEIGGGIVSAIGLAEYDKND